MKTGPPFKRATEPTKTGHQKPERSGQTFQEFHFPMKTKSRQEAGRTVGPQFVPESPTKSLSLRRDHVFTKMV